MFLKCEYNMDCDSHRSPWSNQYFPPIDPEISGDPNYVPFTPSADLLDMEAKANDVFSRYAKTYYDNDFHTSVYFFETQDQVPNSFGSCWLIKKCKYHLMLIYLVKNKGENVKQGEWDAIHFVTTSVDGSKAKYRVNSTITLSLDAESNTWGNLDCSCLVLKSKEDHVAIDDKIQKSGNIQSFHIRNIGKIIE